MSVIEHEAPKGLKKIQILRYVQLVVRLVEGLAAGGIFVSMVLIEGLDAPASWMSKVVPVLDFVISVRAMICLVFSTMDTLSLGSTVSHTLSFCTDAGSLSAYVLVWFALRYSYSPGLEPEERGNAAPTSEVPEPKIVFAMLIACAAMAGMHVFNLIVDVFLAVALWRRAETPSETKFTGDGVFRVRSSLGKHKYKTSDATLGDFKTANGNVSVLERPSLEDDKFPVQDFISSRTHTQRLAAERQGEQKVPDMSDRRNELSRILHSADTKDDFAVMIRYPTKHVTFPDLPEGTVKAAPPEERRNGLLSSSLAAARAAVQSVRWTNYGGSCVEPSSSPSSSLDSIPRTAHRSSVGHKDGMRNISGVSAMSTGTVSAAIYDGLGFSAVSNEGFSAHAPPPKVRLPLSNTRSSDERVASQTGAAIATQSPPLRPPKRGEWLGLRGRREVSGKVAEEGRGGQPMGIDRNQR